MSVELPELNKACDSADQGLHSQEIAKQPFREEKLHSKVHKTLFLQVHHCTLTICTLKGKSRDKMNLQTK